MQRLFFISVGTLLAVATVVFAAAEPALQPQEWRQIEQAQDARIRAIESVQGSVVAVFGNDRMGGGSGVLISPDGLGLTNFHVVAAAGEQGLAGLADGKLYHWKVVGFDPGGDLAVIQLADPPASGFPFARLGDSQSLRVGDWAMAMGNPFVLAEDFKPTVTLGIISGLHRFQEGEGGKGSKLLVYGDCIQVDSSINPGNSGGPLFNLAGQLIGINGRGSFEERGRVNVGVGYAISIRQIENFLPDLLATKVCVHATLDATFRDQNGKVICESINRDGVMGKLGLDLTDVLLSFDGQLITSANQFNNLITTVPAGWPVEVVWEHDGRQHREIVRLEKLPYDRPPIRPGPRPRTRGPETRPSATRPAAATQPRATPLSSTTQPAATEPMDVAAGPATRPVASAATRPATRPERRVRRMPPLPPEPPELRPSEPGEVRDIQANRQMAQRLVQQWTALRSAQDAGGQGASVKALRQTQDVYQDERKIGSRTVLWTTDGREKIESADALVTAAISVATLPAGAPVPGGDSTTSQARGRLDLASPVAIKMLVGSLNAREFAALELQGGDKVQGQRAYQILLRQPSRPPTVFWFGMLGEGDRLEARLLKVASADETRLAADAAVSFADFHSIAGIMFPHRQTIVQGLAEVPVLEIVTTSCQALTEIPPGAFPVDATQSTAATIPDAVDRAGIHAIDAGTPSRAPSAPASDANLTTAGGNFLSSAIVYAQKRCVKILGASVGVEHGYATGIIVSSDGKILTAQGIYTVSPEELRVILPDGRVLSGSAIHILRRSEPLQALLLKVDLDTPDYFDLSEVPIIQKGDWVAAVGNWFKVAEGAEPLSANLGVVSLRAPMDTRHRLQDVNLEGDVLLIDAITANPGAPGSALVTADGRLAGMIGKVVESKSTNTRINYALPADRLRLFLEGREPLPVVAATRGSATEIGFSGIRIFLLGGPRAPAFIDAVLPDSPAAKAGLQKDDLILRVDNDYVGSCREYQTLSGKWKAGNEVVVVVKRKNEIMAARLTLTGLPGTNANPPRGDDE